MNIVAAVNKSPRKKKKENLSFGYAAKVLVSTYNQWAFCFILFPLSENPPPLYSRNTVAMAAIKTQICSDFM